MSFTCPITGEAVTGFAGVTVNGQIYDYTAIKRWMRRRKTDPVTGVRLCHSAQFVRKEAFASLVELDAIRARVRDAFVPSCWCALNRDDDLARRIQAARAAIAPHKETTQWRSYEAAVLAMFAVHTGDHYKPLFYMGTEARHMLELRKMVLESLEIDPELFPGAYNAKPADPSYFDGAHLLVGVRVNVTTFRPDFGPGRMLTGISFAGADLHGALHKDSLCNNVFIGAVFHGEFQFSRCLFYPRLTFKHSTCTHGAVRIVACEFYRMDASDVLRKLHKYGLSCSAGE